MIKSNDLPSEGYARLSQILKAIPISRTEWYRRVAAGKYPRATKLGKRMAAWRVEDIRRIMREIDAGIES
jgi:predicted DNA-binding transcriptional regulator AlpA